ncbi:MAG: 30S ribosomal protein S7 [Candidatus Thermoplasmatota archaeon]|jgi:small subunit ribosomal protein S7|nr:30S ribosomal protein S7 [Candidatus Thermoplasmatota archaeon]MCL5984331.1 30S ribosomal protein S7 [Candidatus Thermoplasmatota archaeon]
MSAEEEGTPPAVAATEAETPEPAGPALTFPPLFGKYSFEGVEIHDVSLKAYVFADPVYVPHTEGRLVNHPFSRAKMHIVERLANNLMRGGRRTGKKARALNAVRDAFDILAKSNPGANPLQLLVNAVENAAPREVVTRLQFGGISVPRAVDTSPSRRLSVALRNIAMGSLEASKKPRMNLGIALAKEIDLAAKADMGSFAVAKKDEVERIAQSAR